MLEAILASLSLWLPGVGVMLALMVASGFFSSSESALFSLTRDDLQAFRSGASREKLIVNLLGDSTRLLTAILFWNLVINLSYFAVSVVVARRLTLAGYAEAGYAISFLGLMSIILFGEVLPKSLAVVFPRQVGLAVIWPLAACVRTVDYIIPFLSMLTRGLQRGFWPGLKEEAVLDAEDLEKAVDLTSQSSEMMAQERKILHQILDLKEITAEELMRPRGTYVTVTEPVTWRDLGPNPPPGGFAAIVEPGSDQVSGVFWMNGTIYNAKKGLKSFRENVEYVPWCAHVARVLTQLREKLCHVAVVVDEYGETIGLLTQQDVFDCIFAVASNRPRMIQKREAILKVGENVYHLDGMTTLRFLAQHLGIPFDAEQEPSVTVAGLLQQFLKRFPEVGDECLWQGWKLRVFEVSGPTRFRVVLEPAQPNELSVERGAI